MKRITIILAIFIASISLNAKNYNNAIGLRGGFDGGITFKHFLNSSNAIEGILSGGDNWFGLTGLYQWHKPTHNKQLEWYYGGGAHLVFIDNFKGTPWNRDVDTDLIIGLDGVIGIEYSFKELPIVISADWIPTLNLIGDQGLWLARASLSLRYYW